MKQIDATDLMKTLDWIAQTDDNGQSVIKPVLNKRGVYECFINLPLIKKTVIGIGETKIESIDNASKQSSKLIDSYMKEHPKIIINESFTEDKYILKEDGKGYLSIGFITKGESH
ncbi:MAG: hypothetical protein MR659_00820 [Mollicutes bacterium]|nr:hypothetical protein [Mollicutes bacterium]MDD7715135.1 hypothetical protein [Mollicutes bacterium]MDY4935887.1 hypothetical protein [Candidatus Enteromonas sp.]